MSTPYVGEIRMFGGNFAPSGWAFCNGQLLSTDTYQALFALIGTTYGGDGQSTFGLPNLQSRIPVHASGSYPLASSAGTESVTLNSTQIPAHGHPFNGSSNGSNSTSPANAVVGVAQSDAYYETTSTPGQQLYAQSIGSAGNNQPHDNMMPFLAVSFIISLNGIYPSRS